jgi:hypothetical protein
VERSGDLKDEADGDLNSIIESSKHPSTTTPPRIDVQPRFFILGRVGQHLHVDLVVLKVALDVERAGLGAG